MPGPSLGNGIEANMCVSIIEGPVLFIIGQVVGLQAILGAQPEQVQDDDRTNSAVGDSASRL